MNKQQGWRRKRRRRDASPEVKQKAESGREIERGWEGDKREGGTSLNGCCERESR